MRLAPRHRVVMAAAAVVVAAGVFAVSHRRSDARGADPRSPVVASLRVRLVPGASLPEGEGMRVPLTVVVENAGRTAGSVPDPLTLGRIDGPHALAFLVLGPDKRPRPMLSAVLPSLDRGWRSLAPGESFTVVLDLALHHDLGMPGAYAVQAVLDVDAAAGGTAAPSPPLVGRATSEVRRFRLP